MSIILRNVKGSPLTYNELDGNFIILSQSYATTGSNTFIGNQTIQGNLSVFGTASFTFTTSSVTTISASTFAVSISSPTIRYGFYEVLDSGASIASVTSSAILLTGPVSTGGLGTETAIPQYRVPMSNGNQSLVSSNIYSSGSINIVTGSLTAIGNNNTALIVAKDAESNAVGFALNSGDVNQGFFYWAPLADRLGIGKGGIGSLFMSASGGSLENGFFSFNKQTSNAPVDILGNTIITGSLNVTAGVTGSLLGTASYATTALTASYASNVPVTASYALTSNSSSYALTSSYVLNAVSASYVLNAVSSSFASTASYVLNAVSASYVLNAISSSFATTASYVLNAVSSSQAVSASLASNSLLLNNTASSVFATTGSNTFRGTQNITGSVNITGSLVISGSSTLTNIGLATMTGSLLMNTLDGRRLFRASSSLSSSISSSNEPTTASFAGAISLNSNAGANQWNSNFDIYYSGISGSGETQVSSVYTASFDNNFYSDFTILASPKPQITLSPQGSIQSYKLYVYNSGSSNAGWYVKAGISETDLQNGITINLTGPTDTNFGDNLVNNAGFISGIADPTSNTNTITYVSQSLLTFTSSLFDIKVPLTLTSSLSVSGSTSFVGTHTLSGSNTIIGDTVMSGSIIVSGSTTFRNSIFTVTGSQFYTGSSDFKGNQTITGSLRLTSGADSGLFINGQKQFNYISLFHTASISPTQNVSGSFIYSTVATSSGISLVSSSRITFENTGIYNIQFSAQLFTQTGATVDIWLKRNGVNIANSAGKIGPTGNNTYHLPAWNFVDTFTSGSYVEIAYQSNQTNTEFQYVAATGNIPAIPSIIATVTQVA
jgi:hypothetical protein